MPVSTAKVIETALPLYVQGVGNVEAYSTVDVRSQVTGTLNTVEFTEGQDVTAGQLLFTIDPRPFETSLKQAQAALAKDTATVHNAEAVLQRYNDLFARGLMAKADHDTQASSVAALSQTLNVDQGQVDNASLQLQYTRITAPISGRTGALLVHKGNLVRTGDATPLVVINQITPVRVTFSLPAIYLSQIHAAEVRGNARAEVLAPSDSAPTDSTPNDATSAAATGELSFIDNQVDPTTASIKLKATFPNKDRRLWPGQFVQVRLLLSTDPHALVVPAGAVQSGVNGEFVYVVNPNGTVALRPITVARTTSDTAVVAGGLHVGEEVVTDGQLRLVPGSRITIRPPVVEQ